MIHFSPTEYRCMIAGIACFVAFIWALKAEVKKSKRIDQDNRLFLGIQNNTPELLEEFEQLKEDHISGAWSEETIH